MNFARFVDIAKALKLTHQTGRAFHCSFVVRQKKIVCIGVNNYNKTNKLSAAYPPKKVSNMKNFIAGIHSEIDALAKVKRVKDLSSHILINIRINNNEEVDNSCPCPGCSWHLAKAGFKKVFYSTKEGFIVFPP